MPYTVSSSFNKFRENIELSGNYKQTASSRKDELISLLENEFEILNAFPTGSIPRYTALGNQYADLDVMVVLHWGKHIKNKKPSKVLQSIRDSLGDYKTNVRKNGQAVTLYYKSWPNVDIVPVSRNTNNDGSINHYKVPNMNDESWIKSRPRKHSNLLTKKNKNCGSKFKHIIKMIKWWNHQHSNYLQSFHIEVMATKIFSTSIDDYSWGIYNYFNDAISLVENPFWYERSYIGDYLSYSDRKEVIKRLETARDRSHKAWFLTYKDRNDNEKAIEIWQKVFGSKFPSYG